MKLVPSAEMTIGPFFPPEFALGTNDLTQQASGEIIEITGRVTQLDGRALDNVVIEIWQADPQGRYDNPDFFGWGRAATDAEGIYRFKTVKPGAPYINFLILYSGLMRHLETAMFFDKPPATIPNGERLVGKKEGANRYRFDIRLRGEGETPFFGD